MTTLQFLGAARMVTGSCFLVQHGETRILIDCGLVQGEAELTLGNRQPFAFDPRSLDAVVLTHAHLDHTGLVPRLVSEGFRGRILCTHITRELLPILWEDHVRLQQIRDGESAKTRMLYTSRDVENTIIRCEGHHYQNIVKINPTCRLRFLDAGHILGSAIIELRLNEAGSQRTVVFSGDLGQKGKPIVRDPAIVEEADAVVLESTYGDRNHKGMTETVAELGRAVSETLAGGGTVRMPVYAIGRGQDVLYVLNRLTMEGILDRPRVFLDSPMAIRVAEVYAKHLEAFDEEAIRLMTNPPKNPHAPRVQFTESISASRGLARIKGGIILAGSGMCEGGRIQEHLVRHLDDPRSCVIFTGYQVEGTLGRRLVNGTKQVRVMGKMMSVKARIHTINGLSAHADQRGLVEWVGAFQKPKPAIFLVHGEPEKMSALTAALEKQCDVKATMPHWLETVAL